MGILQSDPNDMLLGIDAAGIIGRVGANVHNVKTGDRVFAVAPNGCITDRLLIPSSLVVKIPDDMTFEDAATMPCCFATAIHSLLTVGTMRKGQVRLFLLSLPLLPILMPRAMRLSACISN